MRSARKYSFNSSSNGAGYASAHHQGGIISLSHPYRDVYMSDQSIIESEFLVNNKTSHHQSFSSNNDERNNYNGIP